jgi:hypothetical protein
MNRRRFLNHLSSRLKKAGHERPEKRHALD